MLNELAKQLHTTSLNKGFYANYYMLRQMITDDDKISDVTWGELTKYLRNNEACTKMLLVITELAEIVEEWRKTNPRKTDQLLTDEVEEEFADAFIRLLDLCGFLEIDIDYAIQQKAEKNNGRPYKHGKQF